MKKGGQAIVEFVVALVAVMVLFAGLLQIGLFSRLHTDAMMEARKDAAERAVSPFAGAMSADFIAAWQDGDDEISYSKDDDAVLGQLNHFSSHIVQYAHPVELEDKRGVNLISTMSAQPSLILSALERGVAERTMDVLPVIRNMVYGDDSIEVECEVYAVSERGL